MRSPAKSRVFCLKRPYFKTFDLPSNFKCNHHIFVISISVRKPLVYLTFHHQFLKMNLYSFFLHAHSGLRYVVLLLVLLSIIRSWADWFGRKPYSEGNRKLNLFAMISVHTQLLLGIILYFLSPHVQFNGQTMKDADTRYWSVEHLVMMLIAIALITIGHSRSKKMLLPEAKHRSIALYYTAALLMIIVAIMASQRGLFGMTK